MSSMLGNALLCSSVCGPIADLMNKLAGQDARSWLENLRLFLRKERTWHPREYTGKTFMAIMVGGVSGKKMVERLQGAGMYARSEALNLIDVRKCEADKKKEHVVFVKETLRYLLGLTENCRHEIVLNNRFLALHGLGLCHPNDAFHLRLHYHDQPVGIEHAKLATIPFSKGHPGIPSSVLSLLRREGRGGEDNTPEIDTSYIDEREGLDPEEVWIFRKLNDEQKK